MLRHLGSTVALVLGVLGLLTDLVLLQRGAAGPGGIGDSGMLIGGPIMILGALAYRSAKKRLLGQVPSSKARRICEAVALLLILGVVLLHDNLRYFIANYPVPYLVIPVWALVAYAFVGFRSPKANQQASATK